MDLKLYGSEGMLLLDVEEGRERLQVQRFDKTDSSLQMERGVGFGSYSTKEPVNRFIQLCMGGQARNCGDHIVGSKTIRVLEAMYESASTGETIKCT